MKETISKRVLLVRDDEKQLNEFIEEYKPFVISVSSKILKRYIDWKNDEEYSVALIAFNEAIEKYDENKGSFLAFAQRVIKLRLIDVYRKEIKHRENIASEFSLLDEGKAIDLTLKSSIDNHNLEGINYLRRLEIEELSKELAEYGITLNDLVKSSPKWEATRRIYATIVKSALSNEEVMKSLLTKKMLPIAELEKISEVPRKKIERARRYIIAVIIVIVGDYQYIREYINLEERI